MTSALNSNDLPWLASTTARLFEMRQLDRLPHALLLGGSTGQGQQLLARELAAAILCTQPQAGRACGLCRSCVLHRMGTHEDFHLLVIPEDKKSIGIELVRDLSQQLSLSPQRAPRQVAIIELAEDLTLVANNALLKTLEEPPGAAVLILVSEQPRSLLATIRSRCNQWLLPSPGLNEAIAWLQQHAACSAAQAAWRLLLNNGAPLPALAESSDRGLLELADSLLELLRGQQSALELVRANRNQLPALRRLLLVLLELGVRPESAMTTLPEPLPQLLGLTARMHSSSLQRITQLLWQSRHWTGSGIREDLQMLVPLEQLQHATVAGA